MGLHTDPFLEGELTSFPVVIKDLSTGTDGIKIWTGAFSIKLVFKNE